MQTVGYIELLSQTKYNINPHDSIVGMGPGTDRWIYLPKSADNRNRVIEVVDLFGDIDTPRDLPHQIKLISWTGDVIGNGSVPQPQPLPSAFYINYSVRIIANGDTRWRILGAF